MWLINWLLIIMNHDIVSAPAAHTLSHAYRSSGDISPTRKCVLIKYAYVVIYAEHANKVFFNCFTATISLWKEDRVKLITALTVTIGAAIGSTN